MSLRLATVSFLDAVPLVEGLVSDSEEPVRLTFGFPSRLAEVLYADLADVALLPVVEVFRGRSAGMVPGIGIAARGPVASVKLFSRVPLPEIKRVSVDRASCSSVALLRILLAEMHDLRPDFFAVEPRPENLEDTEDALLVTGDRCFAVEGRLREGGGRGFLGYDLAELWVRTTGLPFVFAVWALGKSFVQRASASEQADLIHRLTRARDHGLANLEAIAVREAAAGRLGPGGENSSAALQHYFRDCLLYVLTEKETAGLQRFFELCLRHAICPAGYPPPLTVAGKGE